MGRGSRRGSYTLGQEKRNALLLLVAVQVAAISLWFVSAAILPEMLREVEISPFRQAALSSGVQIGFVVGALVSAILGIADRFDPRRIIAASAIIGGLTNALLLVAEPGGNTAIAARFCTGALLAGVYPVGMKIAVGWGQTDRGFLVGALVGATTLGSASPHLIALFGGADWRITVAIASICATTAGIASFWLRLGPLHTTATRFDPRAITVAWTNRRVRLAYAGYLGHMWELYAMWAWVAAAVQASYAVTLDTGSATGLAKLTAFIAIAAGGVACAIAGLAADRVGKAEVAIAAMAISGTAALATAVTFGGPVWLTLAIVIVWGISVVPDSAQFSALVADHAPREMAGSLMTLQTALGFALTFITVQATPVLAAAVGWPPVIALMALGPAFGIAAMMRLRAIPS